MDKIVKRDEITRMLYSDNDSIDPLLMNNLIKAFSRWTEEDFIDYVNKKSPFRISRLRKNTYYIH